jgi:hypothetical protein
MRRDAVRAVGGYRAAYRHCEDYDLWLRLAETTRLANLPERLLNYRRSDGQISIRHPVEQQTGGAIALLCHHERSAGRPDPTAGLSALPTIDRLDAVFGRAGVSRAVRERLARGLRYSAHAMRGDGFAILATHIADGGDRRGLWRTVARLLRFGQIGRAAQLAALLLRHRTAPFDAATMPDRRELQVGNRGTN